MKRSASGFTIVELLIVIVIIAILATIVVVAYNGIQNRANDVAVQSDINNAAKVLQIYKVNNGAFPTGTTPTETGNALDPLGLKFSRGAYISDAQNGSNVFYVSDAQGAEFAIVAKSKSGKAMYYSSKTGIIADYTTPGFPILGGDSVKGAVGITGQHVWGLGGGIWSFWVD